MNEESNAIDKALDKALAEINHTIRTSLINCYLVEESFEIDHDTITIVFEKYQDDAHYNFCCITEDFTNAIYLAVTIEKYDFIDWVMDNEVNIIVADETDNEGFQIQREYYLSFKDYCNESTIKRFLNEGGQRNVEEI
jgi:hypothetical protein